MKFEIKESDIHYEYNSFGYMMFYKGKPIGGAGVSKSCYSKKRASRSNTKLFRDYAEATKRQILNGHIDKYMLDEIKKIESGER